MGCLYLFYGELYFDISARSIRIRAYTMGLADNGSDSFPVNSGNFYDQFYCQGEKTGSDCRSSTLAVTTGGADLIFSRRMMCITALSKQAA
jgi:hypothetical protein